MRIDPNVYRMTLDKMSRHMENYKPKDRPRLVSKIASATGVPAVAVCLYLITFLYPRDKKLKVKFKSIVSFYNYTEIVPFEKKKKS